MSDCRYGVSPVNYPDPDPAKEKNKFCSSLLMSDLALNVCRGKEISTRPYTIL